MTQESSEDLKIEGEPISEVSCRFTVDRPMQPDRSYYFANKEQAEGSSLAEALFDVEGVAAVLISHNQITVTKNTAEEWQGIGKKIGDAIRAHHATGKPAVSPEIWEKLPLAEEIRVRVEDVLNTEINPAVAAHGGVISLIDVKENVVYLRLGGGCQGCGMADVTLKQGIETSIRYAIPEVGEILDVTDHASGRNPYYTPSNK